MSQVQPEFKEEQITSPIDGSDKCYRVFTEPETDDHYLCMTTGYTSNSKLKVGSEINGLNTLLHFIHQ